MSSYEELKKDIAPLLKLMIVAGTMLWVAFLIWLSLIIGDYLIDVLRNHWYTIAINMVQFVLIIGGLTAAIILGKK